MKSISQQPGHYVNVNGLNMYYEIHGSGKPLVLIHGGGSTIQTTFARVLPLFAKSHQVIAVELQAHGHTADINRPTSFEQDADDVAALLTQLHIANADIFGFSNGGSTALQIAIRHPQLVRKLIVASALSKREGTYDWFWEAMDKASLSNMPRQLKDAYLSVAPRPQDLQVMHDRDAVRMQRFTDWPDDAIRSISSPVFFISSDQDVIRPEHTVAMYRLVKNARLAILPGAHGQYIGEITTAADNSEIVSTTKMIEDFLEATMPK